MEGNPQYEMKRWVHFGACALNVILVLTTVIVLSNSNDISLFTENKPYMTERIVLYLIIGIGIESIGMFGAYYELYSLTTFYICICIFKSIGIFVLLNRWWYTFCIVFFFYVVSYITSIRFLASLTDELPRRQNHTVQYNHSQQTLSWLPPEQSTFQQLPGQSRGQQFQPLPLHNFHSVQPLPDDPNPSLVINVTDTTAITSITTSGPAEQTPSDNEESKPE